ncbi:transcription/translation regulatory transformer protein RfaH [Candidatus Fukatsuia symbiotica]|uniref:Transcription antitermination protein RfaH n=1 Tax=Candidatus Fukatsuia symbiotica TaxID=1878942 RepID=A0A2U8I5U5_9GAMM|nr:transcription/translation regulatory transformer protein RfaH [Candidatus Fukatsuia symbiotica]AWK14520.1 transcription/translation regulatory transformer protein RfaH [Candidatus Fukatsuia symbiotica]MEA9444814.1 transcription/translation regulatory transformer protein RfaH [Candidatus Fukatsuia symbiotica]
MKSWYLLYCKRAQQLRAQEHLERQGVVCLTPTVEMEKIFRRKRITVTEPLFPNYLFTEFSPENIHTTTIKATRGVSHFVRFGIHPVIIPQLVIDDIKLHMMHKMSDPRLPVLGDVVRVTEGIFAGLQAIYTEPDGETRSILLLNMLNSQVTQSLDNRHFEK